MADSGYTIEKNSHADSSTTPSTLEASEGPLFDAARTKTLLRKMDWHLVPFLSLLYLWVTPFCFLISDMNLWYLTVVI